MQNQIRFFIWFMCTGETSVIYKRWQRKFVESPNCSMCASLNEENIHAVRDCIAAKEILVEIGVAQLPKHILLPIYEGLDELELQSYVSILSSGMRSGLHYFMLVDLEVAE